MAGKWRVFKDVAQRTTLRIVGGLIVLLPRLVLAVAGGAAVVVGLRAAWRSSSATTPLIVGGVLLALAVILTPDLERFRIWFKEGGVDMRRSVAGGASVAYTQVTAALEAALREPDGDIRASVQALAAEAAQAAVDEAVAALEQPRPPRTLADALVEFPVLKQRVSALALAAAAAGPKPAARHEIEDGTVVLHLRNAVTPVGCAVTGPDGSSYEWRDRKLGIESRGHESSATYPTDFRGAPPLQPGKYAVSWFRLTVRLIDGEVRTEYSGEVAQDSFEIDA